MGLRPTEGHDDTVWKNQLAGESARVGQALPPANPRLQPVPLVPAMPG